MGWWDWNGVEKGKGKDGRKEEEEMSADEKRAEFEKLVKRCVVVDNLAGNVTTQILVTAFGQFGSVRSVKIMRDVSDPKQPFIGAAVVEMDSKTQAVRVVNESNEFLFMIGQMPRPARAIHATSRMMVDHPWRLNPNKRSYQWIAKDGPGGKKAIEHRILARKHATESAFLWRFQRDEEAEKARLQEESLGEHMEKWTLMKHSVKDGTIARLKNAYGLDYGKD